MAYLLKLGPVILETEGLATNVYLRVESDGAIAQPVFGDDDTEGLRQLTSGEPADGFFCEVELTTAAEALGLRIGTPPEHALKARAAIAVYMAWGQLKLAPLGSERAIQFVAAVDDFFGAEPWRHFSDHTAVRIRITGDLDHTYEAVVLGQGGVQLGLALYETPGSLARVLALQELGDAAAAAGIPAIAVTLSEEPGYATKALEAGGHAPRLPIPMKTSMEGIGTPSTEESLALIAALKVMAVLSPIASEAQLEVSGGGKRVAAFAEVRASSQPALN